MNKETQEEIKQLALDYLQGSSYKRGKDWNGYEVYEPVYKEFAYTGLPLVVLVKDDEVKLSSPDEAISYLNFAYPAEDEE